MTDNQTPVTTSDTRTPIQIDIVSDVVCPWCYIGKRNLEAALASRPDIAATIHWRPYQLDPTIPPGGYERQAYIARKFGDRAPEIYARVEGAAKQSGLDLAFERIKRSPNTLDAHRLIRWSWSAATQDVIVESLFRAFFVEGEDIGDREVLVAHAARAGMDAAVVRRLLDQGSDTGAVEAEIAQARELGVAGVPFFIIEQNIGLSGAQPAEVISRAIDKAAEGRSAAQGILAAKAAIA